MSYYNKGYKMPDPLLDKPNKNNYYKIVGGLVSNTQNKQESDF